ncbi:hypothetical protein GGS23DRAFT_55350 [Durotheca rogersii]|uniref:uncharacterized protein n=1 Tax=Durotheca rogersii TaxID=419775 RepID=UPI00221FB14C|nr:uncharacterized protein GGS23DRAFT_55350 [Durotheca rogersii]KAI5863144.1 hypothetical protein GGS23DRAFT_55350 [Durotheca rogersii]
MRASSSNPMNWWAIVHLLNIVAQIGVCTTGTATYILSPPSRVDDSMPSFAEFWSDSETNRSFPWISGAVGAFATFLNIILLVLLWKTYTMNPPHLPVQNNSFRNLVLVGSVLIALIAGVDITLAVKAFLTGRFVIGAAAGIAGILSLLTIFIYQIKLQNIRRQRKENYVLELAGEGTSVHAIAPPSYTSVVGIAK